MSLSAAVTDLGVKIPVALALSILTLWTLFGNSLVIVSLFKFKSLRIVPNLLIGNLALSDFLLALTVLPLSSVNNVLGHWVFGMAVCNVWLSLDVLYCTASIWSLVVIAFDRFTATVFPIWYRSQRKLRRFGCYSLFIWLLSGLICLPPLIGWDGKRFIDPLRKFERSLVPSQDNSSDTVQCDLFKEKNYVVYSATGSFILPLVVMVILYSRIFFVLQSRAKILRQNQKKRMSIGRLHAQTPAQERGALTTTGGPSEAPSNNGAGVATGLVTISQEAETTCYHQEEREEPELDGGAGDARKRKRKSVQQLFQSRKHRTASLKQIQRADQREQRATHRMLIIIVIFVICWMPFTLMYLIRGLTSSTEATDEPADSKAVEVIQELAIWLGYANSGLNPILYTIFNKDFRVAFKKLLCWRCHRG